ncbi:hypothetical protein C8J57DRAFT_1620933 [Mycena rebaudengoi]|nr:hypothetical protein C8J57DRAFT_1620933 [Mycena rebaudengoi]
MLQRLLVPTYLFPPSDRTLGSCINTGIHILEYAQNMPSSEAGCGERLHMLGCSTPLRLAPRTTAQPGSSNTSPPPDSHYSCFSAFVLVHAPLLSIARNERIIIQHEFGSSATAVTPMVCCGRPHLFGARRPHPDERVVTRLWLPSGEIFAVHLSSVRDITSEQTPEYGFCSRITLSDVGIYWILEHFRCYLFFYFCGDRVSEGKKKA